VKYHYQLTEIEPFCQPNIGFERGLLHQKGEIPVFPPLQKGLDSAIIETYRS